MILAWLRLFWYSIYAPLPPMTKCGGNDKIGGGNDGGGNDIFYISG